jgi:hypothetical protein
VVLPLMGGTVVRGSVVMGPMVGFGPDAGVVVVVVDDPVDFFGDVVVGEPDDVAPPFVVVVCEGTVVWWDP